MNASRRCGDVAPDFNEQESVYTCSGAYTVQYIHTAATEAAAASYAFHKCQAERGACR